METKPYSIQSPEIIARDYGGNKQKIAQAAQMGLLDPTAAVLAGMFIDRVRGAQAVEQAPQQTVAQQVLSAPPPAPTGAGLGATPEAMQMAQAYPAESAPPPTPQQPVMAAEGGLMSLPVDGDMFPDGYAEGGIVAFADGGLSEETQQRQADKQAMLATLRKIKAAGMDVLSLPGRGVLGAFESGVTRPLRAMGVPIPYLPSSVYGGDASSMTPYYDALMREGEEPLATGVKPDAVLPAMATARPAPAPVEQANVPPSSASFSARVSSPVAGQGVSTAPPKLPSFDNVISDYFKRSEEREKKLMEELNKPRMEGKAFSEYEERLNKEAAGAEEARDEAKNMALVKAGLAIMSGNSPYALQNIGAGAMAGVENYQAAMKDLRRADKERDKEYSLIEQARRAEAKGDLDRRDKLLSDVKASQDRRDEFGTAAMLQLGAENRRSALEVWKSTLDAQTRTNIANAQIRASASRGGQGLTPYQVIQAKQKAIAEAKKTITEDAIRSQVAKQLKLSKVPAPGANARFDANVLSAYNQAVTDYVNRDLVQLGIIPAEGGQTNPGFVIEGME
jgi:hypothetical protein